MKTFIEILNQVCKEKTGKDYLSYVNEKFGCRPCIMTAYQIDIESSKIFSKQFANG